MPAPHWADGAEPDPGGLLHCTTVRDQTWDSRPLETTLSQAYAVKDGDGDPGLSAREPRITTTAGDTELIVSDARAYAQQIIVLCDAAEGKTRSRKSVWRKLGINRDHFVVDQHWRWTGG